MVFNIAEENGVNMQALYLHFRTSFIILLSCGTLLDVGHWSLLCDWSHNMPGQQISEFTLFIPCGFE